MNSPRRAKRLFASDRSLIVLGCLLLMTLGTQPIKVYGQTYTDLHDFYCPTDGCLPIQAGILAQGRDGSTYGTLRVDGPYGLGTVYKITPSGIFTELYAFSGPDGETPYSGLTLSTDGNLYGTTYEGGAYGYGTVFKITSSGNLTTLHTFTASDGYFPFSPPILGKNGLYGVTWGTAYKITSSGTFKFLPNPLPGEALAPIILASDGNFYGTTFNGGNAGYGTVFRLSSSGAVTTIYNFDFTHGANPAGPVVQGNDGNLYGTTQNGGSGANPGGVVFKMTLKGGITVLHEFDSTSITDGSHPAVGLVAATDGNFYGATYYAPGGGAALYGNLFSIAKSGTYSNLYDFYYSYGIYPLTTPMQHTNGILYGTAEGGGYYTDGVFWKLDAGIMPFVSIVGFPAGNSGQTVEILGQGFNTATSVKFGSGSASFKVVSDTYLTATVPDAGTTGVVTVTTSGGTLNSKQTFKVLPVLTSFSPTGGPVGTQVAITGSGFTGATTITFNGVKATFTVNSGTQIKATVPNGATTGKIRITTPGGMATSKGTFTVT